MSLYFQALSHGLYTAISVQSTHPARREEYQSQLYCRLFAAWPFTIAALTQHDSRAGFTGGAARWLWACFPAPSCNNHGPLLTKTPFKGQWTKLYLISLFMASEADFGLGSGFNVAFRSALWWAIWHPPLHLCCLHWQGWMKHGFYCYSIGQLSATFSEAKQICEENKAYLATVTDRYGNVILCPFKCATKPKSHLFPFCSY